MLLHHKRRKTTSVLYSKLPVEKQVFSKPIQKDWISVELITSIATRHSSVANRTHELLYRCHVNHYLAVIFIARETHNEYSVCGYLL